MRNLFNEAEQEALRKLATAFVCLTKEAPRNILKVITNQPDINVVSIAWETGYDYAKCVRNLVHMEKNGIVVNNAVGRDSHYSIHPDVQKWAAAGIDAMRLLE